MSQLDLTTYTSQLFWLLVVFLVFYIFAFNIFLPQMAKVFKTRNKTIEFFNKEISAEQLNVGTSESFISDSLKAYKDFLETINLQSSKSFETLKKSLLTKYYNYFFSNKVYNSYIVLKK